MRPDLPVGLSLSMFDDQAVGAAFDPRSYARGMLYGSWIEAVKGDDFLGVQNYERMVWDDKGRVPVPTDAVRGVARRRNLPGLTRWLCALCAYEATKCPIIVTENGASVDDDAIRARMIPAALHGLKAGR